MEQEIYEKLKIYQKSFDLTIKIYKLLNNQMPKEELYGLSSQIKRAISSVTLNIVEGKSRFGDKEFAHFLNIAYGSLKEVKVSLKLSEELYSLKNLDEYYIEIDNLSKMIYSFRKSLLSSKHKAESGEL